MNKLFCILLPALLCFGKVFSQVRTDDISKADSIHQRIVKLYNAGDMAGIYAMSDSSFQQFIAQKDFSDWLHQTRQNFGEITRSVYSGVSGGFHAYKTSFQQGVENMLIALDPRGKISGFAIRPAEKERAVGTDNSLSDHIDSIVENTLRPYIQQVNTFGLSVGVIVNGREYRYNYGERGNDHQELPDANSIYEIGSITKTFTATLLAEFALQHRCRLDDPVNDYLPSSIPLLERDGEEVTLKMLANHTSGLPRIPSNLFADNSAPDDPYEVYDTTRLFHYLDTVQLRTTPGRQLSYSNLGFGLLGTVLARESGEPWETLLDKYICDPLKMEMTHAAVSQAQQQDFLPGHDQNGRVAPHWHFRALAGCGAIRSCVNDMLKYLRAHIRPDTTQILGKAIRLTEEVTHSADHDQIGLGWFLVNDFPGTYWHNGGTGGFSSYCAYNPDQRTAIIILSNSAVPVDGAGTELIRRLLSIQK